MEAAASGFSFTQAELASPSKATNRIQIQDPKKIANAYRRCAAIQPFSRFDCNRKMISPGTHVINDASVATTLSLPRTYSWRLKGRLKYSGKALLTRSGETRPGPRNIPRMKVRNVWARNSVRKNVESIENA